MIDDRGDHEERDETVPQDEPASTPDPGSQDEPATPETGGGTGQSEGGE